jgi:ABC-type branched-subunit amino acid transport system substrate-binding protein
MATATWAIPASASPKTAASATTGSQLDSIFHITPGPSSGKGLNLKIAGLLSLSGPATAYGSDLVKGAQLAIKQIAAAGGPNFSFTIKDDQSANPTAQAQIARQAGEQGDHLVICQNGCNGELPFLSQYQMLAFDGGAGTNVLNSGKPYFFGGRSNAPDGSWPGVADYIAAKYKNAKRIVVATMFPPGPQLTAEQTLIRSDFAKKGVKIAQFITGPVFGSTTDFTPVASEVAAANPDLVVEEFYGPDDGLFIKQLQVQGVSAPVIGVDFEISLAQAAGASMTGYMFADDYFAAPANPFGKLFLSTYKQQYHSVPDITNANGYEEVFIFWQLIRRVLAKHGNPASGAQLYKALLADPTAVSVYGSGASAGSISWSTTTHAVVHRPMVLGDVLANGQVKILATFDTSGSDFKLG